MARQSLLGGALALLIVGRIDAARFVPLGFLPDGDVSYATDISADGTVVVGGDRVFRWTETTGMTSLGVGPGGNLPMSAAAISGDGQTIVGALSTGQPFKWTQAAGITLLPPRFSLPVALSYDGSIIVGGPSNTDVSWDGSVVVGTDSSEAYRDKDGIRTWLGDLPGFDYRSAAQAVSADGAVVVGGSATVLNVNDQQIETDLPIAWTDATGMVPLMPWVNGTAKDIAATKVVIVGGGAPTLGAAQDAYRWTPATDMVSIRELLLADGINVAAMGWKLESANATSANGRVIVGAGMNPSGKVEAWLVELDVPGDFDADGDSDGNDFLFWQRGLGTIHDAADLTDWRANIEFAISLASSSSAAATAAVPEPSAALISVLLALVGCHRQRVFNQSAPGRLLTIPQS
jgi:uncharacterized membrane protein